MTQPPVYGTERSTGKWCCKWHGERDLLHCCCSYLANSSNENLTESMIYDIEKVTRCPLMNNSVTLCEIVGRTSRVLSEMKVQGQLQKRVLGVKDRAPPHTGSNVLRSIASTITFFSTSPKPRNKILVSTTARILSCIHTQQVNKGHRGVCTGQWVA